MDELRYDMRDLQGRMNGISANLASISTSLAPLTAAIAISSSVRRTEDNQEREAPITCKLRSTPSVPRMPTWPEG